MNQRKIKIFLGAYINSTNSQNLNCLALAQHLDKNIFQVFALELYSGNLESQKGQLSGVRVFNCFRPFKFSKHLGYFWGIYNCDIAYLPKRELSVWTSFWIYIFRKKSFSTVEGIYDEDNLKSAIEAYGSYKNFVEAIKSQSKLYSITSYLNDYNFKHHGIKCESKILYLGCDTGVFKNNIERTGVLKSIIYIGRLKKRKGIYDLVMVAERFPSIEFNVYGNGEEENNLRHLLSIRKLENVNLKGIISHVEMAKVLEAADLHILPSRSEGFPKVTLETATAGVPSVVYADYGAEEWITNEINGWVVKNVDEMIAIINDLKRNPQKLEAVSKEAIKLAISFDWKVKVKDWEEVIKQLYNKNK